jgi:hypothetical protein
LAISCVVLNRDLACRGVFGDAPTANAAFDEEGVLRFVNDSPAAANPGGVGAGDDGDGTSDPFIGEDGVDIPCSLNRGFTLLSCEIVLCVVLLDFDDEPEFF